MTCQLTQCVSCCVKWFTDCFGFASCGSTFRIVYLHFIPSRTKKILFFVTVFLKVCIFPLLNFDFQLVTVIPSDHTVVSATTQLETATVGQTSGVAIATAVTKAWWAFPRVLSVTATQLARGSCLVWPTTYATARLR